LLTEELASFAADKRLTEGGQNPDNLPDKKLTRIGKTLKLNN